MIVMMLCTNLYVIFLKIYTFLKYLISLFFSVDHYQLVQLCLLIHKLKHLFFYYFLFCNSSFVLPWSTSLDYRCLSLFLLYTHILICEYMVILCFFHWMCTITLDFVFFFLNGGKKSNESVVFIYKKQKDIRIGFFF